VAKLIEGKYPKTLSQQKERYYEKKYIETEDTNNIEGKAKGKRLPHKRKSRISHISLGE